MNSKGKKITQLTKDSTEEWAPTILNETEITFLRQEKEGIQRYQLNLNSLKETALPHPQNCILDDKNILYASQSGKQLYQCDGNIFLADKNGNSVLNLTKSLEGKSFKAAWFPTEDKILFSNNQNGNTDIYSVDVNGENLKQLTNHQGNEESGAISPDGKYLIFSSNQEGKNNQELYIQMMETGEVQNITNTPNWELIGRWSGDGKRIYFGSNKDGNWELYVYHLQSKKTKRLTFDTAFDGDPRVLK